MPERVRTNTQAVLHLAWGGLAKGNQSVQQAEASVVCQKSPGAGASRGLGLGPPGPCLGGGWRMAETAAAEVAGTGYPPYPPKKRVFTLSVTETIQHAPGDVKQSGPDKLFNIRVVFRNDWMGLPAPSSEFHEKHQSIFTDFVNHVRQVSQSDLHAKRQPSRAQATQF